MAKTNLTFERASELLAYDPETGVLSWKRRTGRVREGDTAGYVGRFGYRQLRADGSMFYAHRVAWLLMTGAHAKGDIDHINGERDDNRGANLRDVTRSANLENQRRARRGKVSGAPLGVHKNGNRWCAQITVGGKLIHLGSFGSPEAAHQCYLEAKRQHHATCTI